MFSSLKPAVEGVMWEAMCLPCCRVQPSVICPAGIMGRQCWQSLWGTASPAGFHGHAGFRSSTQGLLCCCSSCVIHLQLPLPFVSFRRPRGSMCWGGLEVTDLKLRGQLARACSQPPAHEWCKAFVAPLFLGSSGAVWHKLL